MTATLSFLGAAGTVTGSRFLIEQNGDRVLVDCGLYQERDQLAHNWDPFRPPADTIDTVLLTHAHIDHTGYLPRLVKEGFHGRSVCTPATADLVEIMLKDSAKLQREDAINKRKRHRREKRRGPHPVQPLYTLKDANRAIETLAVAAYGERARLTRNIDAEFSDAGHILGAATARVRVRDGGTTRTVLFSGDLGRAARPFLRDPEPPTASDYLVMESTYGDGCHAKNGDDPTPAALAKVIERAVAEGGNVIIPAFAVGRTQEILYHMKQLTEAKAIPPVLTFVDSPMATSVTKLYRHHAHILDAEAQAMFVGRGSPFEFPGLKFVRSVEESKAINQIRGTAVIIAGSGMCNGGRVKHHLVANIERPENTVLFVGYQAEGTLGRHILRGDNPVRILGVPRDVRARIEEISGLSAHADRDQLVAWAQEMPTPPREVFVVHGEPPASGALAEALRAATGWKVTVPARGDVAVLG